MPPSALKSNDLTPVKLPDKTNGSGAVHPHEKRVYRRERAFLQWIMRQPCCTCGSMGAYHEQKQEYLVNPSHVMTRGAGGEDLFNVLPQCLQCHSALHTLGVVKFQEVANVDLEMLAQSYAMRYLSLLGIKAEEDW